MRSCETCEVVEPENRAWRVPAGARTRALRPWHNSAAPAAASTASTPNMSGSDDSQAQSSSIAGMPAAHPACAARMAREAPPLRQRHAPATTNPMIPSNPPSAARGSSSS